MKLLQVEMLAANINHNMVVTQQCVNSMLEERQQHRPELQSLHS